MSVRETENEISKLYRYVTDLNESVAGLNADMRKEIRILRDEVSGVREGPDPVKKADPWAHRSEGMRCSTCMWFAPKGEIGRCRRHAPTTNGYPAVFVDDWCGDHKLDETKL